MKYFVLLSLVLSVFAGDVEFDLTEISQGLTNLSNKLQAKIEKQYDDIAQCIQDLKVVEQDMQQIADDVASGHPFNVIADLVKDEPDLKKALTDCENVQGVKEEQLEIKPVTCIKDVIATIKEIGTVEGDIKNIFSLSGISKFIQDAMTLINDIKACEGDCGL